MSENWHALLRLWKKKGFKEEKIEFIPIKLQMHTGPRASCIMAEALETSVSLGIGGPASLNRDNLNLIMVNPRLCRCQLDTFFVLEGLEL